jgi:hypothetical protein
MGNILRTTSHYLAKRLKPLEDFLVGIENRQRFTCVCQLYSVDPELRKSAFQHLTEMNIRELTLFPGITMAFEFQQVESFPISVHYS